MSSQSIQRKTKLLNEKDVATLSIEGVTKIHTHNPNIEVPTIKGNRNEQGEIAKPNEIRTLDIKESEAEDLLVEYLKGMHKFIKHSYPQPKDIIIRIKNSVDNYWLTLSNTADISSLCIISIENTYKGRNAVILHASAITLEELSILLEKTKRFMWENASVDEIRVELRYVQSNHKLVIHEPLKAVYCVNCGFKWKIIVNSARKGSHTRTLILALNTPTEFVHKESKLPSNVVMIHYTILGLASNPLNNKSGKLAGYECELDAYCTTMEAMNCARRGEKFTVDDDYLQTIKELIMKSEGKVNLCKTLYVEGDFSDISSFLKEHEISCREEAQGNLVNHLLLQ
eukprot:TRINITY_DN13206_c0_g5_i1.p1 TRINITY_DN13206_c0_g5~~TRINITY_DN13206_c0_g5_i1.p1  ORF type:complete len:398 (+),score=36.98 TRINITY_DN13206_c0_g5_i1:169-1194(+)